MSSVNVLPYAPPKEHLYPVITSRDQNFRLQKINEIPNTLDREVNRLSPRCEKKYKRAKRLIGALLVVDGCLVAQMLKSNVHIQYPSLTKLHTENTKLRY